MNLLVKLKETSITVVPILLIVLLIDLTVAPIGWALIGRFFVAGLLIIIGLSVFLLGTDIGILPVGQIAGSALVHRRSLPLMLAAGFLIGFLITIAEPDVQVLAGQVARVDPSVSRTLLLVAIALGVGFFVAVGFWRIILQVSYRWLLAGFYLVVFLLASLTDPGYLGISFDSGGVTTGPMTVPFIMALGVGVAAVRGGRNAENDSFGMVGLASIGPIMAVLIMGVVNKGNRPRGGGVDRRGGAGPGPRGGVPAPRAGGRRRRRPGPRAAGLHVHGLPARAPAHAPPPGGEDGAGADLLVHRPGRLPGRRQRRVPPGGLRHRRDHRLHGEQRHPDAHRPGSSERWSSSRSRRCGCLNDQVEEVSGGYIRRPVMLASLSIGVSIAVGIAMLRVVTGLSIWWFLIPGYALALSLTFLCPPLFTAIAFDSGGVASGPMSSTFILSFTLGASAAAGGNPVTDAFGVIAMIAMTPLITIQLLGLLFRRKERKAPVSHLEETEEERSG